MNERRWLKTAFGRCCFLFTLHPSLNLQKMTLEEAANSRLQRCQAIDLAEDLINRALLTIELLTVGSLLLMEELSNLF